MTITQEQKRAIEQAGGHPVELTDPQTSETYLLLKADLFRRVCEILDDEREQAAFRSQAMKNAEAYDSE